MGAHRSSSAGLRQQGRRLPLLPLSLGPNRWRPHGRRLPGALPAAQWLAPPLPAGPSRLHPTAVVTRGLAGLAGMQQAVRAAQAQAAAR